MSNIKKYELKRQFRKVRHLTDYLLFRSTIPRPYYIKWKTLTRHFLPEAGCCETGTYLGETTKFLSKNYKFVISFEPFIPLAEYCTQKFNKVHNVKIIPQPSQEGLQSALRDLDCDMNYWLDGHYSGEGTYKGQSEAFTPIEREIEIILEKHKNGKNFVIAIDDARLFEGGDSGYPTLAVMKKIANENRLIFTTEDDIIFMKPILHDD